MSTKTFNIPLESTQNKQQFDTKISYTYGAYKVDKHFMVFLRQSPLQHQNTPNFPMHFHDDYSSRSKEIKKIIITWKKVVSTKTEDVHTGVDFFMILPSLDNIFFLFGTN